MVFGSHEEAEVQLDGGGGTMYFKPTCVHTTSKRSFPVRNVSRLPVQFEWKIKSSDAALLAVDPASGTIHPNETQVARTTHGERCE